MLQLLDKFLHEPAVFVAVVVGVLSAAVAVASVLSVGGAVMVAVLAGLSSLSASLGGGVAVRQLVSPVANESAAHPDVPAGESVQL